MKSAIGEDCCHSNRIVSGKFAKDSELLLLNAYDDDDEICYDYQYEEEDDPTIDMMLARPRIPL